MVGALFGASRGGGRHGTAAVVGVLEQAVELEVGDTCLCTVARARRPEAAGDFLAAAGAACFLGEAGEEARALWAACDSDAGI